MHLQDSNEEEYRPPTNKEIEELLAARHTPEIQKKIRNATIGIMGLGGLGSAVAGALAKIGVGRLLLSDYDRVDASNLNRQHYFIDQVGMLKTEAIKDNIKRMNPCVTVDLLNIKLDESTIVTLFNDVDILIECFDNPVMKATAMRTVLSSIKKINYIGSSGMAGYESGSTIVTRMIKPGVYIVGDEQTEARPGAGLMAPRVGIAANHQANQALRLILEADLIRTASINNS